MAWQVDSHEGERWLLRKQVPKSKEVPTGWVGRVHTLPGDGTFASKDQGMSETEWLEIWYKFGNFQRADEEDYIEAGGDPAALDEE